MWPKSAVLLVLLFVECLWGATFTNMYSCNPNKSNWCSGYWVYLPNSYNAATATRHPTIVALHGLNDFGNGKVPDINKLLNIGIGKYINSGQWNTAWDFIVIIPQHNSGWFSVLQTGHVFACAIRDFPNKIDENRLYLTGYSSGGGGVWTYANDTAGAQYVAAIAPVCGTGTVDHAPVHGVNSIVQANLPVWAFHNDQDPTVSVRVTNGWINDLNAAGVNPVAKKTLYAAASHDAWTATYNPATSPLYAWFLTHSRNNGIPASTPAPTPRPTPAPTPRPTPAPTSAPSGSCSAASIGSGIGLMGVYYTGLAFETGVAARVDLTVNFVWATGTAPVFPLPAAVYSVRWTGTIRAKFSGAHTFSVNSDDGARLWVNNQLIINQWLDRPTLEVSGTITLNAGQSYSIKLEKYNNLNGATIQLFWSSLPCLSREVVPASQLTPSSIASNAC